MNPEQSKRKSVQPGESRAFKRKRSGNDGKWTTTRQNQMRLKAVNLRRGMVEPGDIGVWVTCARGMEGKAARELQILFDEYGEKMYNVVPREETWAASAGSTVSKASSDNGTKVEDENDIAALVQKEIASLKSASPKEMHIFTPIRIHVECILFIKTRPPVDTVDLAHRICRDAWQNVASESESAIRMPRYLNRLTPISASGRASKTGVLEVANQVLPRWFQMKDESVDDSGSGDIGSEDTRPGVKKPASSFAIRLSSRHHDQLDRDDVIKTVASLIDEQYHKVDLKHPDKVILVDIFKTTLGMSVVDGDWIELKKYNISEIYNIPRKGKIPSGTNQHSVEETASSGNDKSDAPGSSREGEEKIAADGGLKDEATSLR